MASISPDRTPSFLDTFDIGEVAAMALLEEGGQGGRTYTLTGLESLTHSEAVAELGRAAGRDLRFVDLEPHVFADRLTANGVPAWAVEWQVALFELIRADQNSPVTDAVETITSRPPRTLSAYTDRHVLAPGRARSAQALVAHDPKHP